jgi:hypothetical protein
LRHTHSSRRNPNRNVAAITITSRTNMNATQVSYVNSIGLKNALADLLFWFITGCRLTSRDTLPSPVEPGGPGRGARTSRTKFRTSLLRGLRHLGEISDSKSLAL